MNLLPSHSRRRGSAMIFVMALLVVMCVLMLCAAQSITFVKSELKLIEKRQVERCGKLNARPDRPVAP